MASPTETLQAALSAMQSGKIDAAERLFKQILRAQPQHVGALNLLGILLTGQKRYEEAEGYVRRALSQDATSDVSFHNHGLILKALGRPAEAVQQFSEALKINAACAETWNNRGVVFNELKRYREAVADFDRAIAVKADYADALFGKAKALVGLTSYQPAVDAYRRGLAIAPRAAQAWFEYGNVCNVLNEHGEAAAAFDRAAALEPNWIAPHNNRAAALIYLARYSDALVSCERAIALEPGLALPHNNRGIALHRLNRFAEALASCDKAVSLDRAFADAWVLRGNILKDLNRYEEASAAYDEATALRSDFAEAWLGRANVLTELGRADEAIIAYDRALALKPDLAEAWLGRGRVFAELRRDDEALALYGRAQALKPDFAEAWLGRGNVYFELGRQDEALAAYDTALALKPGLAEAWLGYGNILAQRKRYDEAYAAYDRTVALQPDLKHAAGVRLHARQLLCDWTNLASETDQLLSMVRAGKPAAAPFFMLATPSSPADLLQCARRYTKDRTAFAPIWRGEVYAHDRIRIAYLSADFGEHPVAYLTAGLFEHHDRSRFEVTAISFGPDRSSPMRQRLSRAFEHFVHVHELSDSALAELIRQRETDIVIDLMGFTAYNRLGALARRAAPIQVNYLGYSATMGADCIDYILADSTVVPEEQCAFYTEQVVWLPDSYLVNDDRRVISDRTPTRRECGLPDDGFVYCCFNNAYKIAPEVFHVWMRLLKAAPGSVLWLSEANPTAQANLGREAERCGVPAHRLVFAPRMPDPADHLARLRCADLFLDTLPYNAHTTASDALWAGVPVLTCLGATFVGRVGASLLKAVGLDELIAPTLPDYEALGQRLARDPSYLAALRDRLARNRNGFPLFDTARSTRQIEAAYTMMWQRYQRGESAKSESGKPLVVATDQSPDRRAAIASAQYA